MKLTRVLETIFLATHCFRLISTYWRIATSKILEQELDTRPECCQNPATQLHEPNMLGDGHFRPPSLACQVGNMKSYFLLLRLMIRWFGFQNLEWMVSGDASSHYHVLMSKQREPKDNGPWDLECWLIHVYLQCSHWSKQFSYRDLDDPPILLENTQIKMKASLTMLRSCWIWITSK